MGKKSVACFLVLAASTFLNAILTSAQSQNTVWQFRPKVVSAVDLLPQTRLETWIESQYGLDFSFHRWRTGGLIGRRVKPILNLRIRDIDEDNDNYLVVGGGYEYLHTRASNRLTIDNTIIAFATPHIPIAGLLLSDRNRTEFRWINGVYDFRYRNRLTVNRVSQVRGFRFTPYAYGEVFYNSRRRAWNQNESASGVQFPYKSLLMLDTYFLHEGCSNCRHDSVNMIGITLTLFLRRLD